MLSGGERGRLILARELAKPSNLLVLDEPTNDLDLETLDMLQEMLADYQGTILLVSHDRDFLDRVATSVLMSEGDGKWTEYAGGYSDMVAQRGAGCRSPQGEGRDRRSQHVAAPAEPRRPSASSPSRKSMRSKRLPATMEKLHNEIATLEAKLADAALFARDPKAFDAGGRHDWPSAREELATSRRNMARTRNEARGAGGVTWSDGSGERLTSPTAAAAAAAAGGSAAARA